MNTYKTIFLIIFFVLMYSVSFSQQGGYALRFDGNDDYATICDNGAICFTNQVTIECWVKIQRKYSDHAIINRFDPTNRARVFLVNIFGTCRGDNEAGKVEFGGENAGWAGANNWTSTTKKVDDNQWHHIACSYNGITRSIYIDGVLDISASITGNFQAQGTTPITIGGETAARFTLGCIDELRIWNVARSESELKASMYRELITPNTNLLAYYKMSDGIGTSILDCSGNNYTGSLANGTSWIASGCFSGPRQCLTFDGTDDYVSINDGGAVSFTNQITIECWVRQNGQRSDDQSIISRHYSPANGVVFMISIFGIWRGTDVGKVEFGGDNAGWNNNWTVSDVAINDGNWHHIACTYNGTTRSIYVDGRLSASETVSGNLASTPNVPILIGSCVRYGPRYLNADLDELRIWNVARTASQIRENMMRTLTGTETGLKAYYRFDQSDGVTLYDMSSNGYNGTLTNMNTSTVWTVSSAFNTWIGSESNAWCTGGNWSRGSAPTVTYNVGIYKWNNLSNELTLSCSPTVRGLLISSTANPVVASGFTVGGNLLLEHDLNLNGQAVSFGNTGFLSEGSYRICGSGGTTSATQTLNNISSYDAGGLGAVITTTANMGSTAVTRGHSQQLSGSNKSILRYYDIAPTNNTSLNATLVFRYNDNELNGITEANLTLFKSTNSGTTWTMMGGTVNTTANTVTLGGITSFSRWTLGDANAPLPVTLSAFTSTVNNRDVILAWKTSSEINNAGFEVEKVKSDESSAKESDGLPENKKSKWEKIGYVKGKGTVNTPTSYAFEDKKLTVGKYSYRLKQIDNNGNFEYQTLNTSVEIGVPKTYELSWNYPNPFNPSTKIDFQLPVDEKVTFIIYDITGREMKTLMNNEFKKADYYTVLFNGSNLSSGIYFYRIIADKFVMTKKMVLVK